MGREPRGKGPVDRCCFQKASVMRKAVAVGRKLGLTPEAAKTLAELRTPERIQDFINDIKPAVKASGLAFPPPARLEMELPENLDWSV